MAAIFLRDVMLDDDCGVSLACTKGAPSLFTGMGVIPPSIHLRLSSEGSISGSREKM